MDKNRVCLLYTNVSGEDKCICLDLDFVPKVNEKIVVNTIDNVEYNISLTVVDRVLVLTDNYNHWELFCDEV